MTRVLPSLDAIAAGYEAIIFDQWGVLHNGSAAYPGAVAAVERLARGGHVLGVLSNSGKRAAPNAARIARFGFEPTWFQAVVTSGEALWHDIRDGPVPQTRFWPIERTPGDAAAWAEGLRITLTGTLAEAEAVLLMGLPDGTALTDWSDRLQQVLQRGLPVYCTNPDRASPRAGGTVISPGALAHALDRMGAAVTYYGKPHRPVFDAVAATLNRSRLLMVGDSLEHDIAGGAAAGWDTVLIEGGLYAKDFATGDGAETLARLRAAAGHPAPTFRLESLR